MTSHGICESCFDALNKRNNPPALDPLPAWLVIGSIATEVVALYILHLLGAL